MTIGFPGRTNRYLSSWGVQQRIEDSNKPRIEVRGIKQDIWKKAMLESDAVRIKYASKYAGSSNYWKNSIGMNRGLARLDVIDRKKSEEAAFAAWVNQMPARKTEYGDVLHLLEKGYTLSAEYQKGQRPREAGEIRPHPVQPHARTALEGPNERLHLLLEDPLPPVAEVEHQERTVRFSLGRALRLQRFDGLNHRHGRAQPNCIFY